ncbi:uncharacterized protein LOC142979049 [Anticarsia gemmatalis]|uniref:uncharacterized protein LOC142979049 n=1 Tax=Anticarsia gemmatalis TaxID=129554 RepID=UPI003F762BFA
MEEVREPTLLQTVRGHRSEVSCVDAVGAHLVTGAGDRALRLWRWAAARGWDEAARAPDAHRYGVTAARWAPGGVLLASAGVDGAARVWCGRTLAPRRTLAAPGAAAARALCWAGRSRVLVGHDDGALHVWHAPRAVLLARLLAHEGALHAVAAPARGALLLTACTDGVLKVFDLAGERVSAIVAIRRRVAERRRRTLCVAEVCRSGADGDAAPAPLTWVDGAHDMGALCADATEDGAAAATGGHDALVRLWRVAGPGLAPAGELVGHSAAVTALRWAGDGAVLASASLDRTARLWSVAEDATCLHVLHAHTRYLTCITLSHDMRYMLTGSNDKSVRMWSLSSLSLVDELEIACAVLEHFALGDLEGIGPVEESPEEVTALADAESEAEGSGARRVWHDAHAHAGPINCIATHGDLVATASSDGWVRVYRWHEQAAALVEEHALEAHQYPAMSVDFGAGGALLLSAGLDGRACLWDVQSGVQLRVLSVWGASGAGAGGEAGGGGVRGARVSPQRPARLLLATDDGVAPLWCLDSADPRPAHVYAGHAEAVTCCAWSADGRVAATGAASGELRVLAPPPRAALLHHEARAHDLGVQSCDFAPSSSELELPEHSYMLATAGCDSFIKLWILQTTQEDGEVQDATVRLVRQVAAHGGGSASLRWSSAGCAGDAGGAGGALLASAGADRWARRAAPAPPLLAAGTLAGELSLWQLPFDELHDEDDDEAAPPCLWGPAGVARWIREYVTRVPGAQVNFEEELALIQRTHDANVTGSRLINDPIDELLEELGYGNTVAAEDDEAGAEHEERERRDAIRARLRDELTWLRRAPPPLTLERGAPHALLCPLSHRLLREPARAADGYTYERANILDWFIAAGRSHSLSLSLTRSQSLSVALRHSQTCREQDGAVSPVSRRRLHNARAPPNYALRDHLRQYLRGEQ